MADKLLYDAKEPLVLAGNKPISDAFLNQFYGTLNVAQVHRFEKLYRDLKHDIDLIAMHPGQFITQINNAYQRFQEHRGYDSFQPMDDKALKYVLEFLTDSIKTVAKEVQKNSAKSLTR